jgi:GTPase SAR1 family protein
MSAVTEPNLIKLAIVGAGGVGKSALTVQVHFLPNATDIGKRGGSVFLTSSFIYQFLQGHFLTDYDPTIEVRTP